MSRSDCWNRTHEFTVYFFMWFLRQYSCDAFKIDPCEMCYLENKYYTDPVLFFIIFISFYSFFTL